MHSALHMHHSIILVLLMVFSKQFLISIGNKKNQINYEQ